MTATLPQRTLSQFLDPDVLAAGGERSLFRTGYELLDDVIENGLQAGDLILVGGAPGVGKTVATLQWARHIARAGAPVTYVCYEHSSRALFGRLLHLETAELGEPVSGDGDLRRVVRSVAAGRLTWAEAGAVDQRVRLAGEQLREYAPRLTLIEAGAAVDAAALDRLATELEGRGVLFVDYLQKVPAARGAAARADRVGSTAEALKALAMSRRVAVVAISAGTSASLAERRVRVDDLMGAETLAYEADVIIMLNEKLRATSRLHTAYDPVKAQSFRRKIVFTVEKNRDGLAPVDVEFTKDFEHYRFEPQGSAVAEQLVDGLTLD